jgi:hypothetical protein
MTMRLTHLLGSIVLIGLSGFAVHADSTPFNATIQVSEVEVRSGPNLNPNYYPTSKLHRGDPVQVVRPEGKDWLAIKPPLPESFSWIDRRFVEFTSPSSVLVREHETPVRVGSRLINQPPKVELLRLPRGTQLTVIGQAELASDGVWLPILPAPQEVRYIPADAIKPPAPARQLASTPPAAVLPTSPQPQPTASATGAKPSWVQAGHAEAAGSQSPALRERPRDDAVASLPAPASSTETGTALRPGTEGRLAPIPATPVGQTTSYTPAARGPAPSRYCYDRDPYSDVRLSPPVESNPSPPIEPPSRWYGPGRLYRAGFALTGGAAYGFESGSGQGRWRMYVVPGPNVSLDSYLERSVILQGVLLYRSDLQTYFMTALQVSPLR